MKIYQNVWVDNHNEMIFLHFEHWTFTEVSFSLTNFLDPHSGQIGHPLIGFIVVYRFQLYEQNLTLA